MGKNYGKRAAKATHRYLDRIHVRKHHVPPAALPLSTWTSPPEIDYEQPAIEGDGYGGEGAACRHCMRNLYHKKIVMGYFCSVGCSLDYRLAQQEQRDLRLLLEGGHLQ